MEFCRPLERPLVMIVGPPLRVGPTIMTAGRSAGRQNSITPSQIMLLLYYRNGSDYVHGTQLDRLMRT